MTIDPVERSGIGEEDLRQLARNLSAVLRDLHVLAQTESGETLADRLEDFLGVDPRGIPLLSHQFPPYQLVDVQVGLESWVQAVAERTVELVGVAGDQRRYHPLSELLAGHFGTGIGPVEYVDVADSPDSTRSCVRFGVFLLDDGGHRSAVLLRGEDPHGPMRDAMVEILDPDREAGARLMAELRRLAVEYS